MVVFFGIQPEIISAKIEEHGEKDVGWGFPLPRHKVVLEWEFSFPSQEDGHVPKDYNLTLAQAITISKEEIHEAVKKALVERGW
jgi:hypothetical protein